MKLLNTLESPVCMLPLDCDGKACMEILCEQRYLRTRRCESVERRGDVDTDGYHGTDHLANQKSSCSNNLCSSIGQAGPK